MERRVRFSRSRFLIIIIFCFSFVWVLLQFLAPVVLPSGSVGNLSGLTVVSDNEKCYENMSFPWNAVYSIGDRMCHQKSERSFFLNENQMPFCSRCTAIWVGITAGLIVMIFYKIELNKYFMFLILLCFVPIGVDGIGQLVGFWESSNIIRVITGLIIGIPIGFCIGIIVDEIGSLYKSKTS